MENSEHENRKEAFFLNQYKIMENRKDYKDITEEDIQKAFDEVWKNPKPGNKDYYGPIGNGLYQIGTCITAQGGWDMFNKELKKQTTAWQQLKKTDL